MDKHKILDAIRRIAAETDDKPPGRAAFENRTGIRMSEWYPHLWLRWGDALRDAGFAPNRLQIAIDRETLIEKYIALAREFQRLPLYGELKRRARTDKNFPSASVFAKIGDKQQLLSEVLRYSKEHPGCDDIVAFCEAQKMPAKPPIDSPESRRIAAGFVYLMKSGRHFKIGHTKSVGSRERQLAIKIPVPPQTIHSIETDDPAGVEAYWHKRFDAKRGEGEWFELSADDVRAFKRWRRIV